MVEYINISYISPVLKESSYSQSKNNIYILFISSSDHLGNLFSYKSMIQNFNNVTKHTRAYNINKSIKLHPSIFDLLLNIKIFCLNPMTNIIKLVSYGNLKPEDYEYGNKSYVTLHEPYLNLSCKYLDDTSLLQEIFNNMETKKEDSYCLLFFSKLHKITYPEIEPSIINYTNESKNIFIFNRYVNNINVEYIPSNVQTLFDDLDLVQKQLLNINSFKKTFCNKQHTHDQYLKTYYLDKNIYTDDQPNVNIFRRIKYDYRELKFDEYANNMIVAPVDARIRGFNINDTLKITLNKVSSLKQLIKKYDEINGGSGFYSRLAPQDYKGIFVPYSGYLTNITHNANYTILRVESHYYIPPNVGERIYLPVMYGNHTYGGSGVGAGTRHYPYALDVQLNNTLIYYLIISGNANFITHKFKYFNQVFDDLPVKKFNYWLEQGEEICECFCGNGQVVFATNRPIDFTQDIKLFSQMDDIIKFPKGIDTYVKARDIVGALN